MRCQKCQTENSQDRKFCYECGGKLLNVTGPDSLKEALDHLTNKQGCAAQNIRAILSDEQGEEGV